MKISFIYINTIILIVLISILHKKAFSQQGGWSPQMTNMGVDNLTCVQAISPTIAIASTGYYSPWPYANVFQFYKTTNGGTNWTLISTGNFCYINTFHFLNELTGYAGGGYTGPQPDYDRGKFILKTTNGGINWTTVLALIITAMPSDMDVTDLHFINSNTGWACSNDGLIERTTNGGMNFISHGFSPFFRKKDLWFVNNQTGWVAGDSGRITSTSNGGLNWIMRPNLMTQTINSLYFLNTQTGYACNSAGFHFKTTNAGVNWSSSQITTTPMYSIFYEDENHGWIAGTNYIIGYDTAFFNSYSTSTTLKSISFCDSIHGWSCGGSTMLYTTTGGITGIISNNNATPVEFSLEQNYPNPFNPYTTLSYELPKNGYVRLVIYDLLGKEVSKLVENEFRSAGSYSINFNGSNLSSGMYFYVMKVNDGRDFSIVKKMIIIK